MKKTRAEQETIIIRAADEQEWEVFSEDPRVLRRMTSLWGAGKPKGQGQVWRVPPTGISFRKPRALGAAERERLAERLRQAREGKS